LLIVTYQHSANEPEYSTHERKGFHCPPAMTVTIMAISIPIPSTKDATTADALVRYPLIQDSEAGEPADTDQEVDWVVHEAPCKWYDPDEAEDC